MTCTHAHTSATNQQYKISASILSADFARLGDEAKAVLAAGADEIHFDVMDNHYVPNLTIGPVVCAALRAYGITAPIDVHLMTKPVDNLIVAFAKAGATAITFHPEASEHIDRSLQLIHEHGCKAGLAFNPATPLDYLDHVLDKIDIVLIMAVNPGFGGQEFIPSALAKISAARAKIAALGATLGATQIQPQTQPSPTSTQEQKKHKYIALAVDGGIKTANITTISQAGANTFVVGSTIFHSKDAYTTTIAELRKNLRASASITN